jgi:hypothetical protein
VTELFSYIEVLKVLMVAKYLNREHSSFKLGMLLFEVTYNSEKFLVINFVIAFS